MESEKWSKMGFAKPSSQSSGGRVIPEHSKNQGTEKPTRSISSMLSNFAVAIVVYAQRDADAQRRLCS